MSSIKNRKFSSIYLFAIISLLFISALAFLPFGEVVIAQFSDFTQVKTDFTNKTIFSQVNDANLLSSNSVNNPSIERPDNLSPSVAGDLDVSFVPVLGASSTVNVSVIQPDGKILVGGDFYSFNGVASPYLARLNNDGTLDTTFNIGTGFLTTGGSNGVYALGVQQDGKILVGGEFKNFNGQSRNRLVRLNIDGTLDSSFNIGTGFSLNDGTFISPVRTVAIQNDGKIIVGGEFNKFNGLIANRIARLNNDGSLDTTFNIGTGFNSTVSSISILPDGKIIVAGSFFTFNGSSVNSIGKLNTDGSLDSSFNSGSGSSSISEAVALTDGKFMIGGIFDTYDGVVRRRVARINANGSLDSTFDANLSTGFDSIHTIAIQQNGKILIGGLAGVPNGKNLFRLNVDGSTDNSFDLGAGFGGYVFTVSVQTDGKILVGGNFTSFNGIAVKRINRINSNGAIDNSFGVIGAGFNNGVNTIATQSDGKILIGGNFTTLNNINKNGLVRLNNDGTLDGSFNIGSGVNGTVNAIAIQSDGKILVGGYFTNFNGTSSNMLVRLNIDGSIDSNFSIGTGFTGNISPNIGSIAIQPDGKLIVGGNFTLVNGVSVSRLVRLDSNGTIDNSFNTGTGFNNFVSAITIQPDGKVLIGGSFTSFNGQIKNRLLRLNNNGLNDTTFNTGAGFTGGFSNPTVNAIAIQTDGKIVIGGDFGNYNGVVKNGIVRILSNGSLDATFNNGNGFNNIVYAIRIQSDGRVFVGGAFTSFNFTPKYGIIRLNIDGTLDTTFNSGTGFGGVLRPYVSSITPQTDGRILIGGDFATYNGFLKDRIARLFSDIIPLPDLEISNTNAPASVEIELPFNATWDLRNIGSSQANGPWKEKVFLSADNQIGNDTLLGELPFTGNLPQNQLVNETINLTIPTMTVPSEGDYFLIIKVDADNVIPEGQENNNTVVRPIHVVRRFPDLQIPNATVPTSTNTDSPITVSWNDLNNGNGVANAPWADKVFLSTDNQVGNDIELASFPFETSLNPNQSANRIQSITIPRNVVVNDGQHYLIIKTDANNQVNEGTNEGNNTISRPITVTRPPFPDLIVAPNSIVAPNTAFFDQTIQVQWTVQNIGNGSTNASQWQDWVYISSDNLPEIEDPYKAPIQNVSYLAAGESYTATGEIKIPRGLIGTYNILVWTDSDGTNHREYPQNVIESNELNNWNVARPIQINAPLLPDLQTTLVQAPESTFAGGTIPLTYRVENQGTGGTLPLESNWSDYVYLSTDTTLNTTGANADRQIAIIPHSGIVPIGQGYNATQTINIPSDIAGNHYVFVVADGGNSVYEFTNENNNANYDRVQPGSPMSIGATPPDLIIPTINAPTAGQSARQINVTWTVQNQGAFDAPNAWFDTVYLSDDNTPSPETDTALGTIARNGTLGAGLSYNASANVNLPSCISGSKFIYVYSDSRKQIFEYDPNYNAEANNFSTLQPIQVTNIPSDLRVTSITNNSSINAGQPTPISWTVANQGTGETLETSWVDRVYLSQTAILNTQTATVIGAYSHEGVLNSGANYSRTENIVIPNTAQGTYYVIVTTDASENVEECSNNGDNTATSQISMTVANTLPDLQVSNAALVQNFIAGQNVGIQWTVINSGQVAANNVNWSDAVYFSTDNVLDGNDRLLNSKIVSGPLAVGGSYNQQTQVTLPIIAPGNYFLIVRTDENNSVFEGLAENNNTNSVAIPFDVPPADLQVTAINIPTNGYSGVTMPVSWTVQNTGTNETIGSAWTDAIVISLDQILDPTDRVIGYKTHNGSLTAGASYNQTENVYIPTGYSGNYSIFVKTDRNNQIAEANENNNFNYAGILLELPPPSDLIVSSVTAPANASPGENVTFQWTIQNIGSNPALGLWTDAVYLSTDSTWDINDTLIGRETQIGQLGVGQTHNSTLTIPLPAINLGQYYVLVRTDVRNGVRETNEANNLGASTAQTNVDVTNLPIGTTINTTLSMNQERYYKTNTPAGETVKFSIDGQDGTSNELFTLFGSMASRSNYDFQFSRPNEPDQETIVPSSQAGNYYNLARADYVPPQTPSNVTVKAEILPYSITSVSPTKGGTSGEVTIKLNGAKFDSDTKIKLSNGQSEIEPIWLGLKDSQTIYATFDLRNVPTGSYDIKAKSEYTYFDLNEQGTEVVEKVRVVGESILSQSFEVVNGGGPIEDSRLVLPASARRNRVFSFGLLVKNNGFNDLKVPLLAISSPNGSPISTLPNENTITDYQIQIMVQGEGRKDILSPGESVYVQLYCKAIRVPTSKFILKNLASNEPINWNVLESYYNQNTTDSNWTQTWSNFRSMVGITWSDFHQSMRLAALNRSQTSHERFFKGDELIKDLLSHARLNPNFGNLELLGNKPETESYQKFNEQKLFGNASCTQSGNPECGPESPVILAIYEAWALGAGTSGVIANDSVESSQVLGNFITSSCEFQPARKIYNENDSATGNSIVAKTIKESTPTRQRIKYFVDLFASTIKEDCPIDLPDNTPIRKSAREVLDTIMNSSTRNTSIPFWVDNETGKVATGISYTGVKYGKILLGGTGSSNFGLDKRLISGDLILTAHRDCQGKIENLEIETDFDVQIIDAFDFCPGDLGDFWQRKLTKPLARLEGNNWAFDVPIEVNFKAAKEVMNISGNSFKGDCDENPSCPIQPPNNSCPKPCENCCSSNSNILGEGQCSTSGNSDGSQCDCVGDNCGEDVDTESPQDPNDKIGPNGFGEESFIPSNQIMPYTINFENVPTATAAASRVRVTDQLDPNLDWRTFRLKEIGFGKYRFAIPENRAFYQGRIQLGAELGNVFADVTAGIDIATGRVTWTLQAIDPTTGEPPNNANYGLLPPNNAANDGQGFVTYTVKPKITATTGTVIRNNATIIFDTEEPITTNTVSNTLDADLPTSAVNALPPTSPNNFTFSWTGSDANGGSGLQSYDIWVSANNGAYQPFLSGTTETSATFEGQPNTTYKFYSIARDNAGNVESAPTTHDAITVTSDGTNNPVPTLSSINPNSATAGGNAFTLTVNGTNFINSSVVYWNGQPRPTTFVSPTQLNAVIVAADIANVGTTNITVVNPTPGGGTSGTLPFNIIQSTTQADLRLTMVDSGDPVLRGQNVVYQITVANFGANTANNVVVQDEILSLGAISTITSSVGTCTITRGDLANCNLGSMLNQATATITVTIPTNESVGNRIRNYASVNSATPDPNTDNNSKLEETSVGASVSSYGSTGYRYLQLTSGATPPTNFGDITFNDSNWNIGQAAFGNGSMDCSPIAQINTNWLENTRLLIRKKIILPSIATNVRIAAGIDDDVEKVFFNGVQIGGPDLIGGCPVLDSVFYDVPQNLIQNGENVVAFQVFDRGGVSFFDMRVLSEQSIPTFAETVISGRVTASDGRIFKNATLTLTSTDGTVTKIHQTNPFGYYRFMNVPTGKIYLLSIESKHHTFTPNSIVLNVFDKLENVNFVANP